VLGRLLKEEKIPTILGAFKVVGNGSGGSTQSDVGGDGTRFEGEKKTGGKPL